MSRVDIHYFSGTGNTKRAVDIISGQLQKNGFEVNQIAIGQTRANFDQKVDYHIFAFSTLAWSAPALVKKYFKLANEREAALLMEFVLHGLAAYSLISKKVVEGKIEFKDLIGSMVNLGSSGSSFGSEEEDLDDFN